MLVQLKVRNFRSIRSLDLPFLYAEDKAPNGWKDSEYLPFVSFGSRRKQHRILPFFALYGANASGKTSILEAILALKHFALHGTLFFLPYRLDENNEKETRIELSFTSGNKIFSYSASCDKDGISSESLLVNNETVFEVLNAKLHTNIPADLLSEKFQLHCVDALTKHQTISALRFLVSEFRGLDSRINEAFSWLNDNLMYLGDSRSIPMPAGEPQIPGLALRSLAKSFPEISEEFREEEALKLICLYLRKLDFKILRIFVNRQSFSPSDLPDQFRQNLPSNIQNQKNLTLESFITTHRNRQNKEVSFQLSEESMGTQHAFCILAYLLKAIRSGGTILVDELDASLHPSIVNELVRLFKAKELNQKQAQLIFTTHDVVLLSSPLLRKSDVGLVQQRNFEGTHIRRLTEFKNLRNTDNFARAYLEGEFGGLPCAYI